MKFGVLQLDVRHGEWFCQIAIREPGGAICTVCYQSGKKLDEVLNKLIVDATKEYSAMLENLRTGVQQDFADLL